MKKGLAIIVFLLVVIFIGFGMLVKWNSNDVLEAFGTLDTKIEEANEATERRNDSFLRSLELNDSQSGLASAKELDTLAVSFTAYLEGLKNEMLGDIAEGDYKSMDASSFVDAFMFEGDSLSAKGKEFKTKINDFGNRTSEIIATEAPDLAKKAQILFKTLPVTNRKGDTVEWLSYNYKGFPLVASITRITQLQSDVKHLKKEYIDLLLTAE